MESKGTDRNRRENPFSVFFGQGTLSDRGSLWFWRLAARNAPLGGKTSALDYAPEARGQPNYLKVVGSQCIEWERRGSGAGRERLVSAGGGMGGPDSCQKQRQWVFREGGEVRLSDIAWKKVGRSL